ncbi:MAG: NnrS family protein [Betaproteobacteria bacterium]
MTAAAFRAKPIAIAQPAKKPVPDSTAFALWKMDFRPFYLLASIFAAFSVSLRVCQCAGYLRAAYLRSLAWHGHEMLLPMPWR